MITGRKMSLGAKYPSLVLLAFLLILSFVGYGQTYNPTTATLSNKPYGSAQAFPTDARSYFYDGTNFLWRPYQNVAEVKSYLNLSKYRVGQFVIVVDSGGALQSNGTYIGGINTFWMFRTGTTDGDLTELSLFGSSGACAGCLLSANNLTDLASIPTSRSTLLINNVDNTSDITKWAATATLTNKTISGLSNTFSNIPNSALSNNAIGLSITSIPASDISVTTTPAALGTSLIINNPSSGSTSRGPLTSTDWNAFHAKIDSIHVSNDSVYNCANGVCVFQSVIAGGGGSGTVTNFTSGNLSPLFNTTVTTATTTPSQTFSFLNAGAHTVFGDSTGSAATPFYFVPNSTTLGVWFGGPIQGALTLTTTGGSGAATLIGNTLNIPVYSTGSGGNPNSNIGSGYRWAVPNTNNIKTAFGNTDLILDSATNANAITFTPDTTTGNLKLATQGFITRSYQLIGNYVTGGSGDVVFAGPGLVPATIQANAVTTTKINNNAVTLGKMAVNTVNTLLGYDGSGNASDVTVSTGLSLSGGILSSTGATTVSNSDGTLTISPTSGAVVASLNLSHANTWVPLQTFGTLTSTGATKLTGTASGASTDSILTINPSTGLVTWRSGLPFTLFAVQGLQAYGTHGDSIGLGGSFYQPDTVATNGNAFLVTGLPNKTYGSTDSSVIEDVTGKLFKVALPSLTTSGFSGTATFSPSTGILNIPQYQGQGNYITSLNTDVVTSGFSGGAAVATIQPNVVTYAKIQAAAGQGLMGATGAGNFGLVTLGTNLAMSGSVLNATGSTPSAGMNVSIVTHPTGSNFINALSSLPNRDTFYILIAGQSNGLCCSSDTVLAHRGDTVTDTKVQVYDWSVNNWTIASVGKSPLTECGLTISGSVSWYVGKILDSLYGKYVKIVVTNKSSQAINQWFNGTTRGAQLDTVINRTTRSGMPIVDLFIWDQGEQDEGNDYFTYFTALDSIKATLRRQTWFPRSTPIVYVGMPLIGQGSIAGVQKMDTVLRGAEYDNDLYTEFAPTDSSMVFGNPNPNEHFNNIGLKANAYSVMRAYARIIQPYKPPATYMYGTNFISTSNDSTVAGTNQQYALFGQNRNVTGSTGTRFIANTGNHALGFILNNASTSNTYPANEATLEVEGTNLNIFRQGAKAMRFDGDNWSYLDMIIDGPAGGGSTFLEMQNNGQSIDLFGSQAVRGGNARDVYEYIFSTFNRDWYNNNIATARFSSTNHFILGPNLTDNGIYGMCVNNGGVQIAPGTVVANNQGTNGIRFGGLPAKFIDASTVVNGTVAHTAVNSFPRDTLSSNTNNNNNKIISTVYIAGTPILGNILDSVAASFYVASGKSIFGDSVQMSLINKSGDTTTYKPVVADAAGNLFKSSWSGAGSSANIYNIDGLLTGNRTVSMGANNLTFSGSGSISNSTTGGNISITTGSTAGTGLKLQSSIYLLNSGISDANLTIGDGYPFYFLPNISANRTITLPSPTTDAGRIIYIYNGNYSFTWTFSTNVYMPDFATLVTTLKPNTFYEIMATASQWVVISTYSSGDGLRYNHTIFTPTTGGTVNLVNNQYNIINPSGTLTTLTVNLPSSPTNNDAVYVKFTQAVAAVTYSNGTVLGGLAAPIVGSVVVFVYDSGTSTWY